MAVDWIKNNFGTLAEGARVAYNLYEDLRPQRRQKMYVDPQLSRDVWDRSRNFEALKTKKNIEQVHQDYDNWYNTLSLYRGAVPQFVIDKLAAEAANRANDVIRDFQLVSNFQLYRMSTNNLMEIYSNLNSIRMAQDEVRARRRARRRGFMNGLFGLCSSAVKLFS